MSTLNSYDQIDLTPELFFYKSLPEDENYFLINIMDLKIMKNLKSIGEIPEYIHKELENFEQKPNTTVLIAKDSPLGEFITNNKNIIDYQNFVDSSKIQNALLTAIYYGAENKIISEITWLFQNNIVGLKEDITKEYPEMAETIAYILKSKEFNKKK